MIRLKYVLSIVILLILGFLGEQGNPENSLSKLPEVSQESLSLGSLPVEADPEQKEESLPNHCINNAETITVNGYKIHIRNEFYPRDPETKGFFSISRRGKSIYSRCGEYGWFKVVTIPAPGTDIDEDGIPDLIIEYYAGGAHCCFEYTLFSLGKKLKFSNIFYGEHVEHHKKYKFRDIDRDGRYEAIGQDWTFAYWNECFAASPAPKVILRFKKGRFRLAEDMMKKPPPGRESLRKNAYNLRKAAIENELAKGKPTPPGMFRLPFPFPLPPVPWDWDSRLWSELLKLIYTGNGNLAWQYCDWYWSFPAEIDQETREKNKRDFISEFKKQLSKSIYWEDLKKLNGWI